MTLMQLKDTFCWLQPTTEAAILIGASLFFKVPSPLFNLSSNMNMKYQPNKLDDVVQQYINMCTIILSGILKSGNMWLGYMRKAHSLLWRRLLIRDKLSKNNFRFSMT